jgi:hypothetical protein
MTARLLLALLAALTPVLVALVLRLALLAPRVRRATLGRALRAVRRGTPFKTPPMLML